MIPINRSRFLAAAGVPGWPVLKLRQTHSSIVNDMIDTWSSNEPLEGDAAVTAVRGAVLSVQTADCVPILIADRNARVVAAIHAGWRGTAAHIAERTVEFIMKHYSIPPSDLTAVIGPHNAVCCYEVGEDVVEADPGSHCFRTPFGWDETSFQPGTRKSKPAHCGWNSGGAAS